MSDTTISTPADGYGAGVVSIAKTPTDGPYRIRYRPVGAEQDSAMIELPTLVSQIEITPTE